MSDTGKTTSKTAQTVQDTPLTVREHLDPDKHWIGEAIAPPTQTEIAATIGTVSGPGDSPFVARADHLHRLDYVTLDARYINVTGDTMSGALVVNGTLTANNDIVITDAPTQDTHAIRKFDLDTAVKVYRYRNIRGSSTIAPGDNAHVGTLTGLENTGGFTGTGHPTSPLNTPVGGSYAITLWYSGANFTAAAANNLSAGAVSAAGVTYMVPIQPGSTNRVGGTIVLYLAGGTDIHFQCRNGSGGTVTCTQLIEVVRVSA